MNVHSKVGLTMEEIEAMIAKGADAFSKSEDAARQIKVRMRKLRKMFETIRDHGHIGALECQVLAGECDALATRFEADLWGLHSKLTKRAKELGIDLPTVMGGGDR